MMFNQVGKSKKTIVLAILAIATIGIATTTPAIHNAQADEWVPYGSHYHFWGHGHAPRVHCYNPGGFGSGGSYDEEGNC